jgi:nucleoside 2-deoxyribosyltransferase
MIYIAGGFFNDEQLAAVKAIEDGCEEMGLDYFSPRLEGVTLKNLSPKEREDASTEVYEMNIRGICDSDCMVAIIDNYDPGTVFEIGYAVASGIDVITISNNNYGLNVMLSKSVKYHTLSALDAIQAYLGDDRHTITAETNT